MVNRLRQRLTLPIFIVICSLAVGLVKPPVSFAETLHPPQDQGLITLVYHRFDDSDWLSTPMDQFQNQMNYLLEQDFTFLTMEQVHHHLESGRPFPPKSVLIMVDDGYLSFHREAYEFIEEESIPVVVSPYTKATNKDFHNFMDWDQLGTLALDPLIHLGNHSYSHNSLAKRDNADTEWLHDEVIQAQQDIFSSTGSVPLAMVLPYGNSAME